MAYLRQNSTPQRDTVLVLGGPSAGKTVWISRLVEALKTPTEVVGGRVYTTTPLGLSMSSTVIGCVPADEETASRIQRVVHGLAQKQWPTPTMDASEYLLDFRLRTSGRWSNRTLRFVELPGASLLSAFAPSNPSTLTLSWTVANQLERTCAVIALVDPAGVREGSQESNESVNALVEMLRHLRASPDGRSIPVAIVLSKCDRGYKALLAAGGVRQFITQHLQALVVAAGAGRVYVSSATRSRLTSPNRREPSVRRPVENLIEPVAYLLEISAAVEALRAQFATPLRNESKSKSESESDNAETPTSSPSRLEPDLARTVVASNKEIPTREIPTREIPTFVWFLFALGMLAVAVATIDAALMRARSTSASSPVGAPPPQIPRASSPDSPQTSARVVLDAFWSGGSA